MNRPPQTRIHTKATLEFASALYILPNGRKSLSLSKEIGFEPDRILMEMGEYGAGVLSKHIRKEAFYFMLQDSCSMTGMTPVNALPFMAALDNTECETVPDLVTRLEQANGRYITYLLAKAAFGLKEDAELKPGMLEEYLEKLPPEDEVFRQKLQECLRNPEETKVRFCLLVRQFYELVYRKFEGAALAAVEEKKPYYEGLLESDPAAFLEDYLKIDPSGYNRNLDIFLSLFLQIGAVQLPGCGVTDTAILGIRSDIRFGTEVTRNRLANFYKLLADEKRFKLLELLAEGPKYGNELAELLNLSPPTISHHLGLLMKAGVVSPTRNEHRLYYALNGIKVREYFQRSVKFFIKGDHS